jgi:hypothetical protein
MEAIVAALSRSQAAALKPSRLLVDYPAIAALAA